MKITLQLKNSRYEVDLEKGLDISIPLADQADAVNCFYAPPFKIEPLVAGDFIGSTAAGSPVNFKNIHLNPHGNGTHTECVGHIAKEVFTINQCLKQFHFLTKLISINPEKQPNGDLMITKTQVEDLLTANESPALIIRTLPNEATKKSRNYSGTNPPYLHHEAIDYLVGCGVKHLLIDLPSVDREQDEGKVLAHHAFWQYPDTIEKGRLDCTITELIFVENTIKDGFYLLNLSIASFELDASPSKPILYSLNREATTE
ncbi:MAG: cyclase family protein [Saprospiraceae bacterium]